MTREIKFRAWDGEKMLNVPNDKTLGECWDDWRDMNAEIMQFTGLKDRNGKEVFEDDILEYDNITFTKYGVMTSTKVVKYVLDGLGDTNGGYGESNFTGYGFPINPSEHSIVIGNIHENPELLKN